MPINNIGFLKEDLVNHGYHMTAFDFAYNNSHYDVLFENNDDIEHRSNPYASVVLTFIDINHPDREYSVEANQKRMFFEVKAFREFFHINYSENLGNILNQFFDFFVAHVPAHIPTINDRQNLAIAHVLASRGNRDPNAIFCYDARRLGVINNRQKQRSIFISNLTEQRYPNLYNHFKNEPTVTFYYSPRPEDEISETEIITKFTERENLRRQNNS